MNNNGRFQKGHKSTMTPEIAQKIAKSHLGVYPSDERKLTLRRHHDTAARTTTYHGVHRTSNGTYRAQFTIDGKRYGAGHYKTELQAFQARKEKYVETMRILGKEIL